jgi:hypothetical protein
MQDPCNWESALDPADLDLLCDLGNEFKFDPCLPEEMETYFLQLLDEGRQRGEDIESWLRRCIKRDFRCLNGLPVWIQGQAWPVSNGKPMIFVGQVDVAADARLYHDDSSFYVFIDQTTAQTDVVIQVS